MNLGKSSGSSKDSSSSTVLEAQLVDPIDRLNGFYEFSSFLITKNNGDPILNPADFTYNNDLNNIYNNADNGHLLNGYFRVVHDTVNVVSGLRLTPIAIDLTNPVSPPSDQIYIDPERGQFVLPRPVYWSKCETPNNIIDAQIRDDNKLPIYENGLQSVVGKHNNAVGYVGSHAGHTYYLYPFGNNPIDCRRLTTSYWARTDAAGDEYSVQFFRFGNGNKINILLKEYFNIFTISLWVNGSEEMSETISDEQIGHHIYVIIDQDGGLESNKTIRVFIDGNIELYSYDIFDVSSEIINCGIGVAADYAVCWIDDLKIWDHVITEDPSWLYNSGNGREEALHIIYGQANDYKPSNDIKVGYFYK